MQYASYGNNLSKPCSEGHTLAIELDEQSNFSGYLGLPRGQKNLASPGSSGSVVWNIDEKSNSPHPLGIIICKQVQPSGSIPDSLMRVLSFEKIGNEKIEPIDFDDAKIEILNLQIFPDCIIVDRDAVGADNRYEIKSNHE